MSTTLEAQVLDVAYHRNGIGGEGVWFARVRDEDSENVLLAIIPDWAIEDGDAMAAASESPGGGIPCYVIDPSKAAAGIIAFGPNSWRGDRYYDLVREAIQTRKVQP